MHINECLIASVGKTGGHFNRTAWYHICLHISSLGGQSNSKALCFCLGMQGMDDISAALENLTPLEKSIAL